jgi:hypothetical protein
LTERRPASTPPFVSSCSGAGQPTPDGISHAQAGGLAVGVLSNTLLELGVAFVVGQGAYRM